jgi:hypothetical protein
MRREKLINLLMIIIEARTIEEFPWEMIPTSGNDQNGPESSVKIIVSGRKTSEIDGIRKQCSRLEDHGILPATSGRFPKERTGIWLKDTGKIRTFSVPEYCFHEIAGISRN